MTTEERQHYETQTPEQRHLEHERIAAAAWARIHHLIEQHPDQPRRA